MKACVVASFVLFTVGLAALGADVFAQAAQAPRRSRTAGRLRTWPSRRRPQARSTLRSSTTSARRHRRSSLNSSRLAAAEGRAAGTTSRTSAIRVVCSAGQGVRQLYWVGMTEYSAWAVTTSEGIIVIDPLYGYSVEEEIVTGLTKLGLDPKSIRYVVVSHAHQDHVGGAALLQQRGARVVMSAADWEYLATDPAVGKRPRRTSWRPMATS